MISVQNLTKRYVDTHAVEDLSLEVKEGEVLGFLGPNGAGKTTTIRMLTGFLRPTSGTARVAGFDVVDDSLEVRRRIGYLPENIPLYPEMRVDEYLRYRAALKRVPRGQRQANVDRAVELCGLREERRRIVGTLSKGFRQRVGLADALVHRPPILILDEPTVGLDPNQIREVRELIRDLGQDHTVLLSTHILPEVEMICGRVAIIHRGRLVAEGTPERLRQQLEGGGRVVVELRGPGVDGAEAGAALEKLEGVASVTARRRAPDCELEVVVAGDGDPREAIFRLAVERGWVLLGLRRDAASLEDIFARLTTEETTDAASAPEPAAPPPAPAEGQPSTGEGGHGAEGGGGEGESAQGRGTAESTSDAGGECGDGGNLGTEGER
ncbi:MAG: ATP-binding cassette domain-containing protein [Deltaproteobacteria bacterium]|nr:ATP-binding cassette domain-containing protein [Deltaproteobacteria bacterium]